MGRKLYIIGLVIVLLAPGAASARTMTLRIPRNIDLSKLTIVKGSYEHGLAVGEIQVKKGVYDYSVNVNAPVKLLLYCPGYRAVKAHFTSQNPAPKVYTPRFHPVRMIPVRIRFVRSDGSPIANRKAVINLSLHSHEYFGYADGMAFGTDIATGVTDLKGEFSARVPSLLDDPYFTEHTNYTRKLGFGIGLRDLRGGISDEMSPSKRLPAKRSYPKTEVISFFRWATIQGKVPETFLKRNNAWDTFQESLKNSGGPRRSHVSVVAQDSHGGSGRTLTADRKFSMSLRPGEYDLVLDITTASKVRNVPVMKGLVLKDGEDRVINIE